MYMYKYEIYISALKYIYPYDMAGQKSASEISSSCLDFLKSSVIHSADFVHSAACDGATACDAGNVANDGRVRALVVGEGPRARRRST